MKDNVHEGHRERIRKRYLQEGLSSFEDHQVLEFLLFYGYRRQDTNALAHRLINEYGGLNNLLDANPVDVSAKCRIPLNTAILISLIPPLSARYAMNKHAKKILMNNNRVVGEFSVSLFKDKTMECFYVYSLDAQRRLIVASMVNEGTVDATKFAPRDVVQIALQSNAVYVIFAHNHPSGSLKPSASDISATKKLKIAFESIGIDLLDHIIVGGEKYFSFASERLVGLEYA